MRAASADTLFVRELLANWATGVPPGLVLPTGVSFDPVEGALRFDPVTGLKQSAQMSLGYTARTAMKMRLSYSAKTTTSSLANLNTNTKCTFRGFGGAQLGISNTDISSTSGLVADGQWHNLAAGIGIVPAGTVIGVAVWNSFSTGTGSAWIKNIAVSISAL